MIKYWNTQACCFKDEMLRRKKKSLQLVFLLKSLRYNNSRFARHSIYNALFVFQVIDRQLYFTSVEVFVLVCVLLLCRRRGKTSVTDMPPEVRRLIERVPVTVDVSRSPRRNSYTEGAISKQNKMLTVGTSLQKHGSDSSLGTRMHIIIVKNWNFLRTVNLYM